jgi:hypothetical protein
MLTEGNYSTRNIFNKTNNRRYDQMTYNNLSFNIDDNYCSMCGKNYEKLEQENKSLTEKVNDLGLKIKKLEEEDKNKENNSTLISNIIKSGSSQQNNNTYYKYNSVIKFY